MQSGYLDSRRFGIFLVDGQVGQVTGNDTSQMTVHGAWNMRMIQ